MKVGKRGVLNTDHCYKGVQEAENKIKLISVMWKWITYIVKAAVHDTLTSGPTTKEN